MFIRNGEELMAEYCPKCNYKLRIRDWRPECPMCGVNVMYYGNEERLRKEADAAEYRHALTQPKYDRLKFSLIGHPLSVVRLVLGLMPIAAMIIPSGKLNFTLPFAEHSETVGLISVVKFIIDKGLDFDLLKALCGTELLGSAMVCWTLAVVGMLGVAVTSLIGWLMLTLSCSPGGFRRNIAFPVIGAVFATVSFSSYAVMVSKLNAAVPDVFSGTVMPWAYILVLVLYAAMIAVNVIYKKKNIQVKYKDVSELLIPYDERPSTLAKKKAEAAAATAN